MCNESIGFRAIVGGCVAVASEHPEFEGNLFTILESEGELSSALLALSLIDGGGELLAGAVGESNFPGSGNNIADLDLSSSR